MLGRFGEHFSGKTIEAITRTDLLDYMAALKRERLGDRTIFNHISRINTLLKANGAGNLLRASDWPKYDEKAVTAYHKQEIASLFSGADEAQQLLFAFFLATGFREQEVVHCTWGSVDFNGCVISVRSKPEYGFRVKDKEERSVPVPDDLITSLTKLKHTSTSALLFPGPNGKPNGHFLRELQRLAYRAGLNCGECVSRSGRECGKAACCREWGLHKFRKTFATMHSDAGVSAPTIQRWLGHSDLATTLQYLAIADLRSERTRQQVNASFVGLTGGSR